MFMYNQSVGAVNVGEKHAAKLEIISERLKALNSENVSILRNIEDKLHSILNLRSPEEKGEGKQAEMTDYIGQVQQQLDYYQSHCERAAKLLNHLSEII